MLKNYIQETASAPGTSTTFNLAGATAPFKTFTSSFSSGASCFYFMVDASIWEAGNGTFTSGAPNTLARTTVLANSSGTTARLNFASTTTVYNSIPAEKAVFINASSILDLGGAYLDGTASVNTGQLAGRRNIVTNGDFFIWERGASFSTPASNTYNADRWRIQFDGTGATAAITRQAVTDATLLNAGALYSYRYAKTVAGSGGTYLEIQHRAENVATLSGQKVSLSLYAKADTSRTVQAFLRQNFGSGGSATVDSSVQALAFTSSWAKLTATWTLGGMSGKTIGADDYFMLGLQLPINVTETIELALVQVEIGSYATPFERRSRTEELQECRRHYRPAGAGMSGYCISTSAVDLISVLSPPMRKAPVSTLTSSTPTIVSVSDATASGAAIVNSQSSVRYHRMYTNGFSGLTNGQGAICVTDFIDLTADL